MTIKRTRTEMKSKCKRRKAKETIMCSLKCLAAAIISLALSVSVSAADTLILERSSQAPFPDLTDNSFLESDTLLTLDKESRQELAIWPFDKKDDEDSSELQPKNPKKAFFLSLLLPGLGETYVGSKRGILFFAVEAFSWWYYVSNTNEGKRS